ncbi:MAG: sigma-70 family RNA polymerase sigma factor [Sandaracinaceae bacterium]
MPRPKGVSTLAGTWAGEAVDEEDLVARAQAGDPRALRLICESELPRVERLLGRILGPRRDFEDLVQNVFLELCRALPSFQGQSKLSTFIGGITVRVARRALRPSAYDRRRAAMPEELESAERGPEREAIARQRLARLHVALDKVAPKKRIAFALWALDGMSPAEIAELTETPINTVRSRIHHARQELMADPAVRQLLGAP